VGDIGSYEIEALLNLSRKNGGEIAAPVLMRHCITTFAEASKAGNDY